MLKSIKLAIISVIILSTVYGLEATLAAPSKQAEPRLFPYSADGQSYGYVDQTGEWAIQPEFEFANDFSEGLAVVEQDGKFGYINPSGQIVVEPAYDFAESFANGLALVAVEGKFGYIDEAGQTVIEPQFEDASPFSEAGLAAARLDQDYGYIDTSGEYTIEPQFDSAFDFSEGLAAVVVDGEFGFINETGETAIEPQFEFASDFSEGLAVVLIDELVGFIDETGQVVIEPAYEFALGFSEGLAVVSLDEQIGYIDPTGQVVIEPQFDFASSFSEGLAPVLIDDQFGYIDPTGEVVIEPQFDQASPFEEGLARVEQAHKWSVIDPEGTAEFSLPVTAEALTATTVIPVLPGAPLEVRDGACLRQSSNVSAPFAWRCLVAGDEAGQISLFDPCLTAADGQTLVCGFNPVAGESGFQLNLIEPLPEVDETPATSGSGDQVWLVQLADGAVCQFLLGEAVEIDGQPAGYVCSDASLLASDLRQGGPVWQAERVALSDIEGTIEEGFTASETTQTAISAVWQPVDPAQVINEIGLTAEDVIINIEGVAETIAAQARPAMPYDPDAPSELSGEPAHLRFTFDDEYVPDLVGVSADQTQLLIFPVGAYQAIYAEAGLDEVNQRIETLRSLLQEQPETIEEEIPVLPGFGEASQDLAAQVEYLEFDGGAGVRFITHYGGHAGPITDYNTFYTFQGLTDDGNYYIAYFHPASTELLPGDAEEVAALLEENDAFEENYEAYLQETTEALDQADPGDFTPDLTNLDAMIESLRIGQ